MARDTVVKVRQGKFVSGILGSWARRLERLLEAYGNVQLDAIGGYSDPMVVTETAGAIEAAAGSMCVEKGSD